MKNSYPMNIKSMFDGIDMTTEAGMKAAQERLAPWSYTKLMSASCPYFVNTMLENGRGYDFKGESMSARGGENLSAGIAAHKMIENWMRFNMGLEPLRQPGEILSGMRVNMEDWPLLIEQYHKAKEVFAFTNGKPDFPGGEIIGVEEEVHVDYNWNFVEGEGFTKATIDLIQWDEEEQALTITDHKRQWNVLSDTDLEKDFQFSLYASIALRKYPNAHKIIRRMYFIRHGFYKSVECFPVELRNVPETVRQQVLALTLNLYRNMQIAEPFTGEQCSICDIAMRCPALSAAPKLNGTLRNREEAEAVAQNLILFKRAVSELEGQLKDWSSENGNVKTGVKKEFGYVPNKGDSWNCENPAGFLSAIRSMQANDPVLFNSLGVDSNELIKLDQKSLDKTMSKFKKHAEKTGNWGPYKALQSFTSTRITTRFSLHNS